MSSSKKPLKIVQKLIRQVWQLSWTITKKLMSFLLRGLLVFGRKSPRFSGAGFILPTVAMVLLVVALLTTAIVFRSMDRTKNASNVRINEKVLAAVSPAVDRAEAKIIALLADPTLPRSTPTDQALYQAMDEALPQYTLGDETPLKLYYDFVDTNGTPGRDSSFNENPGEHLDKRETLTTAWRFPVDTDNNGKFDSYSLYGIYFRNPTQSANRARSPLEARTPPVDNASGNSNCGAGTAASLVGASGWYKTSDGNLKKSFFVSAATVPITEDLGDPAYEKYTGNPGFAAVEVQQDQARVPLTNNAVVYDDDLEITPGGGIKLNGRIMTNSNFFIGQPGSEVHFYQVSSNNSCFYTAENAKITVGGNVVVGSADPTRTGVTNPVKVDLFKDGAQPDTVISVTGDQGSVTNTAIKASYNSKAYAERINYLVANTPEGNEPPDVQRRMRAGTEREKALQDYYKERTRRVPVAEVPDANANGTDGAAAPDLSDPAAIRPQDEWIYPADPGTGAENNSLTLRKDQPPATDPENLGDNAETRLGDRILVGNGLPAKWWNGQKFVDYYNRRERQPVAGSNNPDAVKWTGSTTEPRTRKTQFVPLSDLGDTDRDGYWEKLAAALPEQRLEGIGGLRVVTGAGIYDPQSPDNIFPPTNRPDPAVIPITGDPSTPEDEEAGVRSSGLIVTFPDSMPMWQDENADGIPQPAPTDKTGDLIMRATAVYHYRASRYPSNAPGVAVTYPDPTSDDQEPIACVSSYYNPSTLDTAKNRENRPDGGGPISWTASGFISPSATSDPKGLSINGLTYQVPAAAKTPSASVGAGGGPDTEGVFSPAIRPLEAGDLRAKLNYQANLIYPDGRFVNEPLRAALRQKDEAKPLTLAHQSSLASAICALGIINGDLATDESVIPHGTIYETSFLDARQVKAIEDPNQDPLVPNDYDLSIEERQPLEIRATVLDLDKLRKTALTGPNTIVPDPEYLLPDSGIIYATREDALLDLSTPGPGGKLTSPVDFILDPTRRPSAIMLVNGSTIARGTSNDYKQEEKGLILVSNLPAYVKADPQGFNLHQNALTGDALEEFDETLESFGNWSDANFYTSRTTKSTSFACRNGQPGLDCNPGDLWRPATVLADSVTLLSNNFRFGFRNEGDYDLRKNVDTSGKPRLVLGGYDIDGNTLYTDSADETQLRFDLNGDGDALDSVPETEITVSAARRLNGFFDNNYLTSADWVNTSTGQPKDYEGGVDGPQGSSYVNNFVTPIQRRTNFPEYVMEMCQKPLVSQCQPGDWFTGDTNVSLTDRTLASDLLGVPRNQLRAGTTVSLPPEEKDRGYPRRVAFQRNTATKTLVLDAQKRPTPIGIDGAGQVALYAYGSTPPVVNDALWFKTTNNSNPTLATGGTYEQTRSLFYTTALQETAPTVGTTQQPLLVPVLQLQVPDTLINPPRTVFPNNREVEADDFTTWMQTPDPTTTNRPTTFNLIIAAGDNPTRDAAGGLPSEFNGGMPNFPNFLENWDARIPARISGSFIQFKRSSYATAPYVSKLQPKPTSIANATAGGIFNYPQNYNTGNSAGRSPYNTAPNRQWGFDVGLLSQLPDAFSQRITTPSAGDPNKFYRELSQDDEWVKTLLCAKAILPGGELNAVNDANRPTDCAI